MWSSTKKLDEFLCSALLGKFLSNFPFTCAGLMSLFAWESTANVTFSLITVLFTQLPDSSSKSSSWGDLQTLPTVPQLRSVLMLYGSSSQSLIALVQLGSINILIVTSSPYGISFSAIRFRFLDIWVWHLKELWNSCSCDDLWRGDVYLAFEVCNKKTLNFLAFDFFVLLMHHWQGKVTTLSTFTVF